MGRITEIRTGEDRETENEGPDIYCEFREPILEQDKQYLHDMMFGIEDPALDLVIMAPEMIMPTREIGAGMPEITVFALIEDCVVDGERQDTVRLYTDFKHAEICGEGVLTCGKHVSYLIYAILAAVCIVGLHTENLLAKLGVGLICVVADVEITAVCGHLRPSGERLKIMPGQEVVDITYNTCTAVTRVRIDTAFLAVTAYLAGIGGVHVFADDIAVIIEGVGGSDYVVRGFTLVGILLLGSRYECSRGGYGVGIGGLSTDGVIGAVLGYAVKTVATERISYLIDLSTVCALKRYARGLARRVCDNSLLSIRVRNSREQIACICVVDRSKIGGNNGE